MLKEDFWGKITNTAFFNLSCSIIPKCLKKLCGRSWDIRLNNFGPNWAQILLLLEEEISWENWLTVSQKYWQVINYKVLTFGPNWTQITHLPLQGIFLKNWLLFLPATGTPSKLYNVSKKIVKVNHKVQGCVIFWTNWPKAFFWGKTYYSYFCQSVVPHQT